MGIYTAREEQYSNMAKAHRKEAFIFSILRGLTFIGLVSCTILFFNSDNFLWLLGSVTLLVGFIAFIGRHKNHEALQEYFGALAQINNEEAERSLLKLHSFETGEEFLRDNHPNQHDLDTLGEHSLYQLINRCSTPDGKKLLGSWLSDKPRNDEIIARQEAVKELQGDLDWLQELQAKSRISVLKKKKNEPSLSAENLLQWSSFKSTMKNIPFWTALVVFLIGGLLTCVGLILTDLIPYQFIYLNIFVNAICLGLVVKSLNQEMLGIDKAQYLITSYLEVIQVINSKAYDASLLNKLKEELQKPHNAQKAIRELNQIGHRISSRANMLYIILDVFLLPDFFLLKNIYKWKKTNQPHIAGWLANIHEFEVLMSVASYARQNERFVYPELSDDLFELSGISIGHPLIPESDRVNNDYQIKGDGSVDIITGSNMSGKSTFQRTLGINVILGRIGAPVCAISFRFSNEEVFTSMRTKDNLSENTSSFYAELKRITQLLETVKKEPTFFLLDEILKGTNSEDRHLGAVSLAENLSNKSAFGLISTHDLTLGALEKTNPKIRNFSFNSQIQGDKIKFDYKLTAGPCKSFNASQLMRNMGIIE